MVLQVLNEKKTLISHAADLNPQESLEKQPRSTLNCLLASHVPIYSQGMSFIHNGIRSTELKGTRFKQFVKVSNRSFIKRFRSTETDSFALCSQDEISPPFSCAWSRNDSKHLLIGDEEGNVKIIDTSKPSTERNFGKFFLTLVTEQWTAHDNAIFHVDWTYDQKSVLTAGGEQNVKFWDIETRQCHLIFEGHSSSIKTVNQCMDEPTLFVTSARDGTIRYWDIRSKKSVHSSCLSINEAHVAIEYQIKKKKRQSLQNNHGVTGATFIPFQKHLTVSSGAMDGYIKMWDIRNLKNGYLDSSKHMNHWKRPHGFSAVTVSKTGSQVFAVCSDNLIYEFNSLNLSVPIQQYSSPTFKSNSFYTKIDLSPCNSFIASGSSNHNLYIWQIDKRGNGPESSNSSAVCYSAHENEVSCVKWSANNQIATCSDDMTVRIWRQHSGSIQPSGPFKHLQSVLVDESIENSENVEPQYD